MHEVQEQAEGNDSDRSQNTLVTMGCIGGNRGARGSITPPYWGDGKVLTFTWVLAKGVFVDMKNHRTLKTCAFYGI